MILSRGLLTFAFFGTDTFVPYALHDGRGASVFAGSVAVTVATLTWTAGTWIQDRWIGRTGEALFVRLAYARAAAGDRHRGPRRAARPPAVLGDPCRLGHRRAGIGLGYSAHSQLTLRCAPAERYGAATASLQLLDNLGVALGTGAAGVIVTLGDDLGWAPGDAAAAALIPAAARRRARARRQPPPPSQAAAATTQATARSIATAS